MWVNGLHANCQIAWGKPRIVEPHLGKHHDLSKGDSPRGARSESRMDIDVVSKRSFRKKSMGIWKLGIVQAVQLWQKRLLQIAHVVYGHASSVLGVFHGTLHKECSSCASQHVPGSWHAGVSSDSVQLPGWVVVHMVCSSAMRDPVESVHGYQRLLPVSKKSLQPSSWPDNNCVPGEL